MLLFIVGMIVGGSIGIVTTALLTVAKEDYYDTGRKDNELHK